ncbi:hypothetical protein [Entomobacter blattae]|uniref:Energy transducer TonB n=1 Tax=Entomobacter blattae TaxID=2762277 RepID=A0A7H1NTD8_9PROT|nr:hypothetical protein [Entomobacter blattae]QNT79048.1 hypothetical protein JGUZn3_18340 [Entomobacter blattae]
MIVPLRRSERNVLRKSTLVSVLLHGVVVIIALFFIPMQGKMPEPPAEQTIEMAFEGGTGEMAKADHPAEKAETGKAENEEAEEESGSSSSTSQSQSSASAEPPPRPVTPVPPQMESKAPSVPTPSKLAEPIKPVTPLPTLQPTKQNPLEELPTQLSPDAAEPQKVTQPKTAESSTAVNAVPKVQPLTSSSQSVSPTTELSQLESLPKTQNPVPIKASEAGEGKTGEKKAANGKARDGKEEKNGSGKSGSPDTHDLMAALDKMSAGSGSGGGKGRGSSHGGAGHGRGARGGGSPTGNITSALSMGQQRTIGNSVRRCYTEDTEARNYSSFSAQMQVTVDENGVARLVKFLPATVAKMASDPQYRAQAERARAAVLSPTCSKLPVPEKFLGKVSTLSFVFRP